MKRVMDLARMRKTVLLVALAATAALLASGFALLQAARPAGAEPPKNGKILFTKVVPGVSSDLRELQTVDPDGSNRSSFTPPRYSCGCASMVVRWHQIRLQPHLWRPRDCGRRWDGAI